MTSDEKIDKSAARGPPAVVVQEAYAAAAGNQEHSRPRRRSSVHLEHDPHHHNIESFPNIEDVPPAPYNGSDYGHLDISQNGMDTGARIANDGRINIKIDQRSRKLTNLLAPALRKQLEMHQDPEPYIPPGLGEYAHLPPPPMNIVIQIVGSRGDVQPFVALGQVLKRKYNHRVRIATHPNFKDFVTENGLEFFSIGGDPLLSPFIADAIIANPPSFAHMHIAEKLGIPLHLMFTMPWSPTQAFPHPLANITNSNADANMTNFVTYALVDMLTWQGLGDMINKFREKSLGLEPVSIMWAPGMTSRLRIPYTYCWSPALIPKPRDWGNYIDISGFFFLNLSSSYTPPAELTEFLEAGPAPVYIGFGSIVVDDPNAMTKMIFEAVKKTGQRALVSKGWGGLGADEMGVPEGVYMLGNCPHDWLFQHVSCVVHHGGAGTTATGILAGRPTVVVPFFGDQPFWGAMTAKAGAGPMPQPYKTLTADKLANAILEALKPESLVRAAELSAKIKAEDGTDEGAKSFHKQLHTDDLRCSLYPKHVAVWRVKRTDIRLSTLAATVLGNEGLLDFTDLKLYRPREYETEDGPWDPISGGAAALIGTLGNLTMGVADFPVEILKGLKSSSEHRHGSTPPDGSASRTPTNQSTQDLSKTTTGTESPQPSINTTSSGLEKTSTNTSLTNDPLAATPTTLSPTASSTAVNASRHASAISTIFSNDGEKHRRWSRHGSRSGSRSGSPGGTTQRTRSPALDDAGHVTMESVLGGASAVSKIVGAGMKSPMDFTNALAKGFHNAPKLYGDDTVRKSEKITGLTSGLTAAGKEFGYGFFDGITGLVTQPLAGAKKEGFAGFVKGAAKGIGGVVLKPGAAIWGLPGYTFKGIYTELQKHFGSSVQNYIIAARTAQGYEEWKASTAEQRTIIITTWKSTQFELRRKGKKYGKERDDEIQSHILSHTSSADSELVHGFKNTRHLSWDERKALAEQREKQKRATKETEANMNIENKRLSLGSRKSSKSKKPKINRCKYCPFDHDSAYHLRPVTSFPSTQNPAMYGRSAERDPDKLDAEYEEAIKRSVTATSKGDPAQDALIERAIRASMKELQKANIKPNASTSDEDVYKAAIQASVDEAKKARGEGVAKEPGLETIPSAMSQEKSLHEHDDDAALTKALTQSLEEFKLSQAASPHSSQHKHFVHHDPDGHDYSDSDDSGMGTEDDEEFKKTLQESIRVHTANEEQKKSNGGVPVEGDDELQRAIEESEKLHREQMAGKDAAAASEREHEIVMEYVKKQSLLEEEHKRAQVGS
jgi:UDP:flavonoid glycosyltransferase YjiC (YdhE family)